MYTPAPLREFITTAIHKRTSVVIISGRTQKQVIQIGTLRGKFKQKETAVINANGLEVIHDRISYTTWWKEDLKSGDILEINGINYEIEGDPENVEQRSRYAVLKLAKIKGGA